MIIHGQDEYSSLDRVVQNLPYQVNTLIVRHSDIEHSYYVYRVKDVIFSISLKKSGSFTITDIKYYIENVEESCLDVIFVPVENIRKNYTSLKGFLEILQDKENK